MHARVGAVFVVDMIEDDNAIKEATKLGIPVIALADTNSNPTLVKYPIPCNDDAVKTIQLACDYMVAAIEAGRARIKAPAATETATEK
jgi:small subunit ribosomal protein S2